MKKEKTLEELRQEIVDIDRRFLGLLHERARLVIQAGRLKASEKQVSHAAAREREI